MDFEIIPTKKFTREAERLIRKYPSLKRELRALSELLSSSPKTGTPLGNGTYKIRLAISSKGQGKRGGARAITYVIDQKREVYLLTIYDKSEFESIDNRTLKLIVQQVQKGN